MSFELSAAGVPFANITPDVINFLSQFPYSPCYHSGRQYVGPGQEALALPTRKQDSTFDLGVFHYPSGASRWSHFNGIMAEAEYQKLLGLAFHGGVPQALTFKMQQSPVTISTTLYMLPAKPLCKPTGVPGLYLISLVDERYFWQHSNYFTTLDENTSWASLISTLATALGISVSVGSIDAAYGVVHPTSDFNNQYENAALALDAALANVGRVFVRNLNGTYSGSLASSSNVQPDANLINCTEIMAGGDFLVDSSVNSILPSFVDVAFRQFDDNLGYVSPGGGTVPFRLGYVEGDTGHIPFSRNEGDCYLKTINLADLTLFGNSYVGNGSRKTLKTSAEAYYADPTDVSPSNTTQINDLATLLATDYYQWQLHGNELTFASIAAWQPDSVYDVEWHYYNQTCKTVITRRPYNFQINEFQHHFVSDNWQFARRTEMLMLSEQVGLFYRAYIVRYDGSAVTVLPNAVWAFVVDANPAQWMAGVHNGYHAGRPVYLTACCTPFSPPESGSGCTPPCTCIDNSEVLNLVAVANDSSPTSIAIADMLNLNPFMYYIYSCASPILSTWSNGSSCCDPPPIECGFIANMELQCDGVTPTLAFDIENAGELNSATVTTISITCAPFCGIYNLTGTAADPCGAYDVTINVFNGAAAPCGSGSGSGSGSGP